MDVKKTIEKRRSIRSYKNEKLSNEIIKELIEAVRLAPSGNNAQPSRYYIVKDDETKDLLRNNEIIRDEWVYNAPAIIVCCADSNAYTKFVEGWDEPNEIRAIRDLSIASSYLVLRATELGLGTCYCGWIKKEEIKTLLNIPKEYVVPYVIAVGYPNENPKQRPRKKFDEILLNEL